MSLTQARPGLWQITRLSAFNCHLVADGDGLTVIDTGLPGTAPAIVRAAARIGRPLRRVLITHGHNDHVGSLDALVALVPGIEVVASARTARLLAGHRAPEPGDEGRPLRGGFQRTRTAPTRIVGDGDRIGPFRAVDAAGHAPGQLAYWHEAAGTLLAGDAFHSAGGRLAVSGEFRWRFPFPYFATWDRGLALDAARRLAGLRPATLAMGHGPVLTDPAVPVQEAIRHAERAFAEPSAPGRPRAAA